VRAKVMVRRLFLVSRRRVIDSYEGCFWRNRVVSPGARAVLDAARGASRRPPVALLEAARRPGPGGAPRVASHEARVGGRSMRRTYFGARPPSAGPRAVRQRLPSPRRPLYSWHRPGSSRPCPRRTLAGPGGRRAFFRGGGGRRVRSARSAHRSAGGATRADAGAGWHPGMRPEAAPWSAMARAPDIARSAFL